MQINPWNGMFCPHSDCNYTNKTDNLDACAPTFNFFYPFSCQKATAEAAATLSESTPCDIGMRTT